MKGRILVVNTGSTSTKIGFFDAGEKLFEQNISHSAREISVYASVLDQRDMRRDAITDFLTEKNIGFIKDLDLEDKDKLINKYSIKFQGKELTERELKGIMAYLESLRSID